MWTTSGVRGGSHTTLVAIDTLYDDVMSPVTQVAFQIDGDRLAALDGLVAEHEFRSRAEALRTAVDEFLRRRREARIDAELEAGYQATPAGADETGWADVSIDGLQAADLDW